MHVHMKRQWTECVLEEPCLAADVRLSGKSLLVEMTLALSADGSVLEQHSPTATTLIPYRDIRGHFLPQFNIFW